MSFAENLKNRLGIKKKDLTPPKSAEVTAETFRNNIPERERVILDGILGKVLELNGTLGESGITVMGLGTIAEESTAATARDIDIAFTTDTSAGSEIRKSTIQSIKRGMMSYLSENGLNPEEQPSTFIKSTVKRGKTTFLREQGTINQPGIRTKPSKESYLKPIHIMLQNGVSPTTQDYLRDIKSQNIPHAILITPPTQ